MNKSNLNRIKEVLKDRNMTQKELSIKLNKSYNMVNSYIQNRRQPNLEILYKIAEILSVEVDSLLFVSGNYIEKFEKPETKELISIALLFNDGKIEVDKLSDMVAMCEFVIDRLYENGTILKKSSKENI